jgi:hypothetical protein
LWQLTPKITVNIAPQRHYLEKIRRLSYKPHRTVERVWSVGLSKKNERETRKNRTLHKIGYHVEKQPLEQVKLTLAGELILGLELLVLRLMVPGHVVN